MRRILIAIAALAVVLAACGGSDAGGVATIEDSGLDEVAPSGGAAAEAPSDEEAVLAFAQCMRDSGIEDFEDPDFSADGSLQFRRGDPGTLGDVDRETLREAFQACQEHLEGFAFGPGGFDRSDIEDRLVEFAACMRDPDRGNILDFPDPDFSNFGPGGGGGPFGEHFLDLSDREAQEALEACQDVFGGFRFAGPGGGSRGNGEGTNA